MDPNELRAQMILKDIYARHGIDPSLPLPDQIAAIEESAASKGMLPVGWSNADERGAGRLEYAKKGKTDSDRQNRWEKSAYLLDPDSYQYMQNAGRDIDFLAAMHNAKSATPEGPDDMMPQARAVGDALAYWDKSNFQPVYRDSVTSPNYQSETGVLQGLLHATANPDVPLANYLQASETIPNRARLMGEAKTGNEAWQGAQAIRMANNRYRLQTKAPVLDLPSGSDVVTKAGRIAELADEVKRAGMPTNDQRWAKWTKDTFGSSFVPSGLVGDTLDFATSFLDPTAVIPVGTAATGAAKVGLKGAQVAGQGWVRPLLANLAKSRLKDFGMDMGVEQGIGHATSGAIGNDRTWGQYLFGDGSGNAGYRTQQEVKDSQDTRSGLYDRLKDDDSVSRADDKAYQGLGLRVHVPYPYRNGH